MSWVPAGRVFPGARRHCHSATQRVFVQVNEYNSTRRIQCRQIRLWSSSRPVAAVNAQTGTKQRLYSPLKRTLCIGKAVVANAAVKTTSSEALRVMNLANESKTAQDAEMAATRLLELTFPPDAMASNSPETQKDLHRSFLVVASLCLTHPPQVELALELARRAQLLSMPFHLPLYQKLVTALAIHRHQKPGPLLLEVSLWASVALNTSLQASFFSDAMVALVQRSLYREALDLKSALKVQHGIEGLEGTASIRMLCQLRANLLVADPTRAVPRAEDAVELVLDLQKALTRDINNYERQLTQGDMRETLEAMINDHGPEAIEKIMDSLEGDSEDEDDDLDLSDDDDDDYDLSESLRSAITDIVKEVKERTHYKDLKATTAVIVDGKLNDDDDDNYDSAETGKIASEMDRIQLSTEFLSLSVEKQNEVIANMLRATNRIEHPALSERVRKVLGHGNADESVAEESDSDVDDNKSDDSEDDGSNDDQGTDNDSSDYDTEEDDADSTDSTSYHDALVNDLVYIRDESSWVLPDVTSQLTKLNRGREALYTRKFEEQLLDLLGGDHDEDDEDFLL
jgi:hypothetical protein